MKSYYVRFNWKTRKVDVYQRTDDSLIDSVEVVNGIVSSLDVERIADALHIGANLKKVQELEYAIFYEDRYWREQEEEQMKELLC